MRRAAALCIVFLAACQLMLGLDDDTLPPVRRSDAGTGASDGGPGPLTLPAVIFVRRGTSRGDGLTTIPIGYSGPPGATLTLLGLPDRVTLDAPPPATPPLTKVVLRAKESAALTAEPLDVTAEARSDGQLIGQAHSRLYVADDAGELDQTFGTAGFFYPGCGGPTSESCAYAAMTLDGQGRAVATGMAAIVDDAGTTAAPTMVVTRLLVDGVGSVDVTFAGGALRGHPLDGGIISAPTAIVTDDAGRILVAGLVTTDYRRTFVARLTATTAAYDDRYGTHGVVQFPNEVNPLLLRDPEGVILSLGGSLVRLNEKGEQAPSWHQGTAIALPLLENFPRLDCISRQGTSVLAQGMSVAADAGGAAGTFVARFSAGGELVATFGADAPGVAGWHDPTAIGGTSGCAVSPDGPVYAGSGKTRDGTNDFLVAKFTETGRLDDTYGEAGVTTLPLLLGTDFYQTLALALQSDGRLVLLGHVARANNVDPRALLLARLEASGARDSTFGSRNGLSSETKTAAPIIRGAALVLDRDGRMLVLGNESDGILSRPFIARFWP